MMSLAVARSSGAGGAFLRRWFLRAGAELEGHPGSDRDSDPVREYDAQKIRIGMHATLLILVVVAGLLLFLAPQSGTAARLPAIVVIAAAALGAATVVVAPWDRLASTRLGLWCLHAWSVFDVLLITMAIGVVGNGGSELFFLYGLTATLFAITQTPRAQGLLLTLTMASYLSLVGFSGWEVPVSSLAIRLAFLGSLALLGSFLSQELRRLLVAQHGVAHKLQELDELRTDFLSTVSHELRTPLAAIAGFAATLTEHRARIHEELRDDLVERISLNAGELDALIRQLLDFSRINNGNLRMEREVFDVGGFIEHSLAKLRPSVGDRRLHWEVVPGTWASADPGACTRILENLVTNAAKFSPGGTRITVRALDQGDEVVVTVSDEGPGVPQSERERVFERFYRMERGDHAHGGTGIGLAIVKQFAEAQGGRVWVDGDPGRGSNFHFTLPRPGTWVPGEGSRNGQRRPR